MRPNTWTRMPDPIPRFHEAHLAPKLHVVLERARPGLTRMDLHIDMLGLGCHGSGSDRQKRVRVGMGAQ